ncbi:MAG: hypothetical protein SH850_09420 [Planctomycetaceae bacterium]|nr:hypothetical protein [Planctomycetaceae bacterium]
MRSHHSILACGFAVFFSCTIALCDDPKPTEKLDWNEPTAKFADFIADLSAKRLEEAWQTYRLMLPEVPKTPQSPFDHDPFEDFKKAIGQFPTEVEAFQLVATRNYSEKSRRMFFIADTKVGPYLVETVIYRFQGQWRFGHFGYHSVLAGDANWHKLHEDVLPVTKLPEPVAVPLPKREPAAETAGK